MQHVLCFFVTESRNTHYLYRGREGGGGKTALRREGREGKRKKEKWRAVITPSSFIIILMEDYERLAHHFQTLCKDREKLGMRN